MFRFKDLMKQATGKQPGDKTGIQLLASILVCYPEIESITYEPEHTEIVMEFIVTGKLDKPELEEFVKLLDDSLQAYHELDSGRQVWMAAEAECLGSMTTIHIHRQLVTLTRGELTLIADLFQEKFGERLKCDKHSLEQLEPDFADAQSAALDHLLDQNQEYRIREQMIGIRDRDRVVVYNR
ncbi:hypothetical protein SAMN02910356_01434 [Selenomonas sp. GACV-9]|uniref:hypothetical protein n=1 Tax=Selenomonas sp. GACV-9 TaxID=3158782 RepID=UPI0008E2F49B|nr:hypothetical protein SAMN02910356_01434 [Selenomonas ruminantium]